MSDYDKHPVCPCGCGELADECGSWIARFVAAAADADGDSRRFDMRAGDVR